MRSSAVSSGSSSRTTWKYSGNRIVVPTITTPPTKNVFTDDTLNIRLA